MAGPLWVVVPTYNEAENLPTLVAGVRRALADREFKLLVVDDASPDGTGAVADGLAAEHAEVEVLHRSAKVGLGPAYVAGFARALAEGAAYVAEIDADLSHDPADLPRLHDRAVAGIDVALGSRYVAGGAVENWAVYRRAISRAGCWYARAVLGVGIRDLTGGFKVFRAQALEAIDYSTVRSQGYAFQVELSYRALKRGLRVEELPIVFHERREGQSKMSGRIALEAVWMVPALRWGSGPAAALPTKGT
jgi:dolichol-phosphate mannosyltransferase